MPNAIEREENRNRYRSPSPTAEISTAEKLKRYYEETKTPESDEEETQSHHSHSQTSHTSRISQNSNHSDKSQKSQHSETRIIPREVPRKSTRQVIIPEYEESICEDDLQREKVSYLVEIDEYKEEGIRVYKDVDIDSDIYDIKLCHAYMSERSKSQNRLNFVKGLVKFGADVYGKTADYFQGAEDENKSDEWRVAFKASVGDGKHDAPIRQVVRKYKKVQLPDEIALLTLIYEDRQKFDARRAKAKKIEAEAAKKSMDDEMEELDNHLKR